MSQFKITVSADGNTATAAKEASPSMLNGPMSGLGISDYYCTGFDRVLAVATPAAIGFWGGASTVRSRFAAVAPNVTVPKVLGIF